ncbi:MAG: PilW family protein [Gammaproteobacteria bacterium]|nr:PilW family protein [Gammaproteobacteria bacterium]
MTLIELMVALGIGSFLMIGAMTVFMQSRTTFRVNESIARLQENGRYVFDVIEPDIRMAQFWGLRTRSFAITGRADPTQPVSALSPAGDCGQNWTVNLAASVEASNDSYGFTCGAFGTAVGTADTLVIRRVLQAPTIVPQANTLYVQSTRGDNSQLFMGPTIPAGFLPTTSQTHELVVNGYYVDQTSNQGGIPSLRRKFLQNGGGGPTIADEEILPGVEDMQVQFGVDTDLRDGNDRGIVDRYVNPDDPILDPANAAFNPDAEILSVRIWLRLRADRPENGLPADAGFTYADQVVGPFNDGFRRIVVSKTIYLRNARPAS